MVASVVLSVGLSLMVVAGTVASVSVVVTPAFISAASVDVICILVEAFDNSVVEVVI